MKTTKYFLIAIFSLLFVNCSAAPKTENANIAWQNSSDMQTANTLSPSPTVETQTQTQTAITPDALVKDLYKTHEKNAGTIVQGKNRQILDKFFDKNMANLIWKDMTTNQDEVGVIDFDIFYNTQDPDIKNLVVNAPKITGDKATVLVTFINYTVKNTLTYSLVKENSNWKISDINYGGTDSLLKYFKESEQSENQNSSPVGEFEGKYQVGDTSCTVTPAKMSFDVKWAKGSGVETFAFDSTQEGKHVFVSDKTGDSANTFIFDDENYNTGIFRRADGKEFPVKRIQ